MAESQQYVIIWINDWKKYISKNADGTYSYDPSQLETTDWANW